MKEIQFYQQVDDALLQFAVIVSTYQGKWVFCRHKARATWECPGGHREKGESIEQAACHELWEETGATEFFFTEVTPYSVKDGASETFGMLYYAEITALDPLPAFEIEQLSFFDTLPSCWTYPHIQPYLLKRVQLIPPDAPKKFWKKPENH